MSKLTLITNYRRMAYVDDFGLHNNLCVPIQYMYVYGYV